MRISVRDIQRHIAADFGVDLDAFYSPSRLSGPCHSRQYAMLLARELTTHSLTVLGRLFGRDHTTVLTGIRSAKKRIAANRELALKLEARALLIQCEPQKPVDATSIGFLPKTNGNATTYQPVVHNPATVEILADPQALAA
jgi:hypothetical protein